MEIRPARVADAAGIADVHVRTWQAAYPHVFGAERLAGLDGEARAERWARVLRDGEAVFVSDEEGRVVAFVSVGPAQDDDQVGELYAIYALPEAWGTGAGRTLIRAGVQALREAGYRAATLWVLEDNPRARSFYETAGWAPDGATKAHERWGVRAPELRYRKRLS